jgi:hypothetical protein
MRLRGGKRRGGAGGSLAVEGLKVALRRRKAIPAVLARYAIAAGIWEDMQPYLEALTTDA